MLYEHRWSTSHSRFRHETQRRFLEVVQPIRELTGTNRTNSTSEQKARRLAGEGQFKSRKRAIRLMPLAEPSKAGEGMAYTTWHNSEGGLGSLVSGTALPWGLKQVPEEQAHQPER